MIAREPIQGKPLSWDRDEIERMRLATSD